MNEQLTQLPEYWCVIITEENLEFCNNYLQENKNKYPNYSRNWKVGLYDNAYFHSSSDKGHTSYEIFPNYTLINKKQFQQWVLNKQEIYELW